MNIPSEQLKGLLVPPGYVTLDDFHASETQATETGQSIEDVLIEKGLIKDDQFGQLVAAFYGMPFVNLREEKINEELLHEVPEPVARARSLVLFGRDEHGVKVAMTNPKDLETVHFLEKRTQSPVRVFYATHTDIHNALSRYKVGLKEEFDAVVKTLISGTLSREDHDAALVKLVDQLMQFGYDAKASDIHVEPHEDKGLIRLRIDGIMHDVLTIPPALLDPITTRIKVLAKLRTDEHRAAQDGKLEFTSEDEVVDVRVSIVPVTEGENVVMRILSSKSRQYSLSDVGLGEVDAAKVRKSIDDPHGMILVTGPTGSGKTTTVYAMLKILNTRDVHIATIEDPVEYEIEGISQIQVNARTNLTFAHGLRSIVRQDPDIIMVGEIRDQETAGIAINSALTGHLVLSTLHANDAATTLPRLLDMGIEPFLVASTVNIIIAQRLVRRLCDKCRSSYQMTEAERNLIKHTVHVREIFEARKLMKSLDNIRLYKGTGCSVCNQTGYLGRVGIFEVLVMSDAIKELVTKRAAAGEVLKLARTEGMTTMMEDGITKVLEGTTTFDEVLRAAME